MKYPKIIIVAKKMKMEAFSMSGAFLFSNVSKSSIRDIPVAKIAIFEGIFDL